MGELELEYVKSAFDTNWISSVGPNLEAFEKEIKTYNGVEAAVALATGTAALHLALKLVGVRSGDPVVCSSFTFAASANPIVYERAHPVFIDSETRSWNMSPPALERALSDLKKKGTPAKAVVIVSLYGQSADMDPLMDICDRHGVAVIEDAAESLGATYKGRKSGTFGRFGIYSFNGNKIITSSGGGALVSRDTAAIEKARFWSTQARDPAPHYEHTEIGFNYRMSNILAGVGLGQMKVLDQRVSARRRVFERYREALGSIEGLSFMPEADFGSSTRWLTVMTLAAARHPDAPARLLKALGDENIEARPAWKPMHMQPVFRECGYYPHEAGRDVCREIFETGICLPSGSSLRHDQQDRIIDLIRKTLK